MTHKDALPLNAEQQRFEAFYTAQAAANRERYVHGFGRDRNSRYFARNLQDAWEAWQAARAPLLSNNSRPFPAVEYVTVRQAPTDKLHLECRFVNGEKYAAITVADEHEDLAFAIAEWLNGRRT